MHNFHIVANTETEKYRLMSIIRAAGALLTGVSGYGRGYYIQIAATTEQAETINNMIDMEAATYASN